MTAASAEDASKKFLTLALENAVAHQRFEGLEPSEEVIADLQLVVSGQLSVGDVIQNIGLRFQNAQIFHA